MKGFTKKIISAAMALTVAASMSVYAEEVTATQSTCYHPTIKHVDTTYIESSLSKHQVNGKTCIVITDTLKLTHECQSCHEKFYKYITEASHSIVHD